MTVYPDLAFFLNTVLDYLLLATASLLSDGSTRRGRLLLSALAGGLYAALAAAVPVLAHGVFQAAVLALMSLLAFGGQKAALRRILLFLLVCCGYGGLVLLWVAFSRTGVHLHSGLPFYSLTGRMLVLLAGLLYSGVFLTLRTLCRHFGAYVQVAFCVQGRRAEATALCDTGNTLTDPLSGEPVMIADVRIAQKLFPKLTISVADLRQPTAFLQKLQYAVPLVKPRLLPFRTVGEDGLLAAIRCDSITVNGRQTNEHILAFSPSAFSGNEPYQVLTGGFYVTQKK